ncbi:MAG: cellulase family glycosylhydrolase [Armatimonadetes bacterium]|nr:cellulase family glycosylhydrolase [Armatimonadota bacterium]
MFLAVGLGFVVSLFVVAPKPLHIEGTQVVDSGGRQVVLRGVNVASLEWSSDGEGHVLKTIEVAIKDWKVNHIRLPMSQDRWFGKAPEQKDGGKSYRKLVDECVQLCSKNGVYIMLDLHWNSPNEWGKHIGQHFMPDMFSVDFWKDVAKVYKNHPAVLFDLYNEPHDTTWEIWKNGGTIDETRGVGARQGRFTPIKYQTPGMQALVNTVRATGARNLLVVGGLDWAYDLKGVLEGYALTDPGVTDAPRRHGTGGYDGFGDLRRHGTGGYAGFGDLRRHGTGGYGDSPTRSSDLGPQTSHLPGNGILYVCHNYPFKGDTFETWLGKMKRYTEKLPVIMSEFGAQNLGKAINDPNPWVANVLRACKENGWMWTAWDLHPAAGPTLISDWNYTPTPSFGKLVKEALAKK